MRIFVLAIILLIGSTGFAQKKIDFGIEVQMNQNLVKKWDAVSVYDTVNRDMSVLDTGGDTLDIYFNKFSMANNFEIPLYFRYSWKNRQFLDLKLSNSFNTLSMDGIANYNQGFFEKNYGTYEDFETQAIEDGFPGVDSSDYENYLIAARKEWESRISYTEQFQLLSLTANYGLRFFPHKSVKAFAALGITIKGKYRKVNYNYLDFSNDYIQDLSSIDRAVNKFAETSVYTNLMVGLEMYRFRLSLFYQSGVGYSFPIENLDPKIVYSSYFTPFDQLHSYGFILGVDLFSREFGKNLKLDDLSEDEIAVSKVKRKKEKWDAGIRFNRRGFNDLNTFYKNPANRLSILQRDSVLINNGGTIMSAENIEMVTFGDIKKIGWSGQFDLFVNYYLSKRFLVEGMAGLSVLNFDVETTELTATIVHDTSGNYYFNGTGTPRLRSGVYRKSFSLLNLSTSFAYKIVDRDLFDFMVFGGVGITLMGHKYQGTTEQLPGVNELEIYYDFEDAYYGNDTVQFQAYQGEMEVDLNDSPDQVISKFPEGGIFNTWNPPQRTRLAYPTFKFGLRASVDRFTLGMSFEKSINYMDGFILRDYGSIYFSIGYKLWMR